MSVDPVATGCLRMTKRGTILTGRNRPASRSVSGWKITSGEAGEHPYTSPGDADFEHDRNGSGRSGSVAHSGAAFAQRGNGCADPAPGSDDCRSGAHASLRHADAEDVRRPAVLLADLYGRGGACRRGGWLGGMDAGAAVDRCLSDEYPLSEARCR